MRSIMDIEVHLIVCSQCRGTGLAEEVDPHHQQEDE